MSRTMTNFRAVDMPSASAEPEAEAKPKAAEETSAPAPEPEEEEQKASPEGTVPEILAWVDEPKTDKGKRNRAQKALDQENADSEPRVTLVAKLEEIVSAE